MKTRFSIDDVALSQFEAESIYQIFEDKEVNVITNDIPGSDVLAIVEEARQARMSYDDFYNAMKAVVKKNKGSSISNTIRKIYIKYVYGTSENENSINILYPTVEAEINETYDIDSLNEIESIINNLKAENKINETELNYLQSLIDNKRQEI